MWPNYLTSAFRNIAKYSLYSTINITSLAIGIAFCIVIYLFITDERSFDAFHEKSSSIYRLDEVQSFPGTNTQKVALSMPGMAPALLAEYPEVTNYTRYFGRSNRLYQYGETRQLIEQTVFVDSTFLDIFDFELLEGDRETALDNPRSMLLTAETVASLSTADKSMLGELVVINETTYTVTGILANVPENSHMQFDALLSMNTITSDDPEFNNQFGSNYLVTYLTIEDGVDMEDLEVKLQELLPRHMDNENINDFYKLFLQPLPEVHLASMDIEHDYHNYRKFNGSYLDVFALVGLFILLIACVNFMNLVTARASYRWKEVGVRKSVGAGKVQLLVQFILETFIIGIISFAAALLIDVVLIEIIDSYVGRRLDLMVFLSQPLLLVATFVGTLALAIISGLYPSFYMASFQPAKALKGQAMKAKKSLLSKGLIVLQFGLGIAMIVSTLFVMQQINFINSKDLGFNRDQILLIDMNGTANEQFEVLKTELLKNSNVLGVTASGQRIGNNFHQWGFKVKTDTAVVQMTPSNVFVDYDYLDVYNIRLKDGRTFSKDYSTDNGMAFVVNEALVKDMGLGDKAVGTEAGHGWYHDDSLGTIIGVAEDFNFNSLHYEINTLAMAVHSDWGYDEMSIKINPENMSQTIAEVEAQWNSLVTDWPFEYSFLDSHFEELYRSDNQMSAVISLITVFAILIACMGLFGLAAITTERRIKEIGIRKILGAGVSQIIISLSKSFAILITIAFILFIPLTYLYVDSWLGNFAYKISIGVLPFLGGGIIALIIAISTVSYHTWRSARANPVDIIRYE